jgi:hypothetical protein
MSWNHTCSGSDRILIVGVGQYKVIQANPTVTYNGVPMMRLLANGWNGETGSAWVFYLINPPTGTHAISVTWADSGTIGMNGVAVSYTGARQSSQPSVYVPSSEDHSTSHSLGLIVTETNCWQILFALQEMNSTLISSSATNREQDIPVDSNVGICIADSNGIVSGGPQSMSWTTGTNTSGTPGYAYTLTLAATDSVSISGLSNPIFFAGN